MHDEFRNRPISINFAGQDLLAKTPAQAARLAAREEERKEAERSLAAVSDKATLQMTRRRAEFFLNLGYHEAMEKHGRSVTNLVKKATRSDESEKLESEKTALILSSKLPPS